jgi:tetratricopeptide (TPR) repeat protein
MSLLLDALKKAALEKQNADSVDKEAGAHDGLSMQPVADLTLSITDSADQDAPVIEELELGDDIELEKAGEIDTSPVEEEPYVPPFIDEGRITPTPSTVSDEALQLLIHKTNHEYRKSRLVTWGGVALGALILLSVSGFYYYTDMTDEIDSMHRKHQIALATLKSKTRIEENLTSLAAASDGETQGAGSDSSAARKSAPAGKKTAAGPEAEPARRSEQVLSVQRLDRRDPVSEALERGWKAYQEKDYRTSMREYRRALDTEPENHDALLGVAAVSIQQNQSDTARDIYIKLLEKDPRDPHAHAGLANIAQTNGSELSETRLKQLIEFRPDDAHLQFALGNLYVQKQSWPEAQQAFFNAWKGDSKNPDYAYNLAVSLDQLGKHEEAKTFYEDSLKLAAGKNISFSTDAVRSRLVYLGAVQ